MKIIFAPLVLSMLLFACSHPNENEHAGDSVADTSKKDTPPVSGNGAGSLYGIDISVYQGDEVDFLGKNKDSLSFVICRATLGATETDHDFANNWKMLEQEGYVRGAYHFYQCGDDPTKQAQHYLEVIGTLGANDLPPILDFEQLGLQGVTDVQKIQSDLLTFLNAVETGTGRVPMIYVSSDFAPIYLTNSAFSKYPLYVADYDGMAQPAVPALWKSTGWTFWQKSDSVKVDGDWNDFDEFNGDQAALQSFLHH